ncbi:uncharacterized protein BDZ99DRAFT_374577 [Mytilinidion resinicola]|uniref:LSM domain-containing protein n=1 Tax=Mytilinidion resinicola TaxID=574789 RepID=A0A6A6ZAN5_9PEZI|nr:uncharacterized protein BDZ99DRAFT_374577 [Mytilinidion resinicola]KAF2817898.1 hypothetical protein BDZ99DRAFT_374577 [Mytilinidion resinicola]
MDAHVKLKKGETLNGRLVSCGAWMSLALREVLQASLDRDKFGGIAEVDMHRKLLRIIRSSLTSA